jgi:hypothetical protein
MPKAHLELSAEVATTTDEGYPSSLRITLTNAGDMPVSMPVLSEGCWPDARLRVEASWTPSTGRGLGIGKGGDCGSGGEPLPVRVRKRWVKLRARESMTTTVNLWGHLPSTDSGTITYWVDFDPPDASPQELNDLWRDGFLIPTEKLRTKEASFQIP